MRWNSEFLTLKPCQGIKRNTKRDWMRPQQKKSQIMSSLCSLESKTIVVMKVMKISTGAFGALDASFSIAATKGKSKGMRSTKNLTTRS